MEFFEFRILFAFIISLLSLHTKRIFELVSRLFGQFIKRIFEILSGLCGHCARGIFDFLCRLFGQCIQMNRHFSIPWSASIQVPNSDASEETLIANPNTPFPFLSLPREIRDSIYRMLLTTHYTYTEDLKYDDRKVYLHSWLQIKGSFNLHPAILRANKQIAEDCKRIVYEENEFVVFKASLFPWQSFDRTRVPAFWSLDLAMVAAPVLDFTMRSLESEPLDLPEWLNLVTTIDAVPLLVRSIWHSFEMNTSEWIVKVSFNSRAPSSRAILHRKGLDTLKKLHGFAQVLVDGNIGDGDLESLWYCMTSKARPNELIRYLEDYHNKAERSFYQRDCTSAWSSWDHVQSYWGYCFKQCGRQSKFEGSLAEALRCWPRMVQANLGQAKLLVHLKHYKAAKECARLPMGCIDPILAFDYPWISRDHIDPLLQAKLYLCCGLASIALGEIHHGNWLVEKAVRHLLRAQIYSSWTRVVLFEELCWAIDNHLKRVVSTMEGSGQDMKRQEEEGICPQDVENEDRQVPNERLSFWEWLEV